jgi:large subunit ribosomal protein L29
MKSSEIRALGPKEIESRLADSREELMKLRFQQVTGQLTDTSRLRIVRRDIARMATVLREMKADVEGEA